jgi:hypothetical protein
MAVTLVISGMACFKDIDGQDAPLTYTFNKVGLHWAVYIIDIVMAMQCVACGQLARLILLSPLIFGTRVLCSA